MSKLKRGIQKCFDIVKIMWKMHIKIIFFTKFVDKIPKTMYNVIAYYVRKKYYVSLK